MAVPTLADLIKINDQNLADLNVTDLLQDAPFLAVLPADLASNGTLHKYLAESGAPVIGFRAVNDGRVLSASADTLRTITLQILDATFRADVALALAHGKGKEAYLAREGQRHLKAAFSGAEKQLIYGVGSDAGGFTGMADILNEKDLPMVVDALGDTADTGSSVWMVRAGENDVQAILGQGGVIEMLDTSIVEAEGTTGTFPAYYTPITGWMGLQNGSIYSFGRICNLTVAKPLTDALLGALYSQFPATRPPTHIVMNRRSREQLRASRTAYSPSGQEVPSPKEWEGIPIVVTDSILNTEALLAAGAQGPTMSSFANPLQAAYELAAKTFGRTVTYGRGESSVQVAGAVPGFTRQQQLSIDGQAVRANIRDELVRAADLVLDGQAITPAPGDWIRVSEDGRTVTSVVTPLGDEPCFVERDPAGKWLRIHTKRTDRTTL